MGGGRGSIFKENIFARNWVKCSDLQRKLMFGNLPIGKGWGQFTKIFVSDIALFLHWTPTPKPLVVMWGIRKTEFHVVLYSSYNFHKKIVFSDMDQCPSPGGGGYQSFNFCGGLDICRCGRIENMRYVWFLTFHWISILNVFSWIGTSTPSLLPWGWCCQTSVWCRVLDISNNFKEKSFL